MKVLLDNTFTIISGPCSLESQLQIDNHFESFPEATLLRAGVFKLRTSPESFQGLRQEAIKILDNLKKKPNVRFVSEIVSESSLDFLKPYVDVIQIGTRNMYNYELLKYISKKTNKPVILKRAFSATIDEWLKAAQYIENSEDRVILCERGIRSFEQKYRNTLDLNAVAYLKKYTNYKVIVDPSHGTGDKKLIESMALASLAVGADGILVETHFKPETALSDAPQALNHKEMRELIDKLKITSTVFDKKVII